MISFLLLRKIAQMFLGLVLGYILVRCGKAKASDSKPLSVVILFIINPCVIINAYQVSFSNEMVQSLALSFGAAIGIHLLFFALTGALRRPLRLNGVEQASCIYSNCVNLLIPIVTSILGKEYIIFTSMYIMVQVFCLWSHCRMLLSGERKISFRNIFGNLNVISTLFGLALFLLRIQLPAVLTEAMDALAVTQGPLNMVVIGMLLAGADLKKITRIPGVWKVTVLRLIVFPVVTLLILKYSGLASLAPEGEKLLLLSLMAACAPTGTMVTSIAQVYGGDAEYASAINMISTVLCIISMPLIIALYQL